MNTTEIEKIVEIHNFKEMFDWAKKQFLAFEVVEGVIQEPTDKAWEDYSFSIDCPQDQMKFKDMLQIRFIEELTEASMAVDDKNHFHEEVTDALNFFLTSYIMLGKDLSKLSDPSKFLELGREGKLMVRTVVDMKVLFYQMVEAAGYLCNLLKNRPWSQSNYLVSMLDFEERLENLWSIFWTGLGSLGFYEENLFDLFSKKLSVNLFRIETGY